MIVDINELNVKINGELKSEISKLLRNEISRLGEVLNRTKKREAKLLNEVAIRLINGERDRATSLAKEVIELRKICKALAESIKALGVINLKLSAAANDREFVKIVTFSLTVLRSIRHGLMNALPGEEERIDEILEKFYEVFNEVANQIVDPEVQSVFDEALRRLRY